MKLMFIAAVATALSASVGAVADGVRTVRMLPGSWIADDGKSYVGPCETTVDAPLSRLPYFVRGNDRL